MENTPNQISKFRNKIWIELNNDLRWKYDINSQIRFNISVLSLSLYDYSDAYILVKGTILTTGEGANDAGKQTDARSKGVIFKNCVSFTDWITEINTAQIDNAKNVDVVRPMYNLTEYSDNYSKTSGSLW